MLVGVGFLALAASAGMARNDDSVTPEHDYLHHHHFAEFAKVPAKARARTNPLESDPDAVAAGGNFFHSVARSATATRPKRPTGELLRIHPIRLGLKNLNISASLKGGAHLSTKRVS